MISRTVILAFLTIALLATPTSQISIAKTSIKRLWGPVTDELRKYDSLEHHNASVSNGSPVERMDTNKDLHFTSQTPSFTAQFIRGTIPVAANHSEFQELFFNNSPLPPKEDTLNIPHTITLETSSISNLHVLENETAHTGNTTNSTPTVQFLNNLVKNATKEIKSVLKKKTEEAKSMAKNLTSETTSRAWSYIWKEYRVWIILLGVTILVVLIFSVCCCCGCCTPLAWMSDCIAPLRCLRKQLAPPATENVVPCIINNNKGNVFIPQVISAHPDKTLGPCKTL